MKLLNVQHKQINYSIQRAITGGGETRKISAYLFSPQSRYALSNKLFEESSTVDEIKDSARSILNNLLTNN